VRGDVTRVHPGIEQVHCLALARPLHPGKQDEHGKTPVLIEVVLRIEQGFAQLSLLALVGGLIDLVFEIGRIKHTAPHTRRV
jgi:hypothetical protein